CSAWPNAADVRVSSGFVFTALWCSVFHCIVFSRSSGGFANADSNDADANDDDDVFAPSPATSPSCTDRRIVWRGDPALTCAGVRSNRCWTEAIVKLCVFGGSGKTGSIVMRLAVEAGHDVTALVRNPAAMAGVQKVTVLQGDTARSDDVDKAVAGC